MAMVLQANRMTNGNSSTVPMDTCKPLHHNSCSSTSSTPPRSASPINNQEDSFRRMIFEKIEEAKRDIDPKKCRQILDDLMKMLKHLTADVNNYNLAFRETRPPFYMQEFQRLTDRIDILTKARDTLTEYLHEVEDQNIESVFAYSSSINDVSSINGQSQYSPSEKSPQQHKLSTSSIQTNSKDIHVNDYSTSNDQQKNYHIYPSSPPLPTYVLSQQANNLNQRSRSPSMTPSNFIRVHFPNKHTTALAPRNDETLEVALESRASRHSVTNLREYTPVYMISRQPCPWDITLDRVLETEIELEEKTKLDHSFIRKTFFTLTYCDACHKLLFQGLRCLVCGYRIHARCIRKSHSCRFESRDIFYRYSSLNENIPTPRFNVFGVPCVVCHQRIRGTHKRCVSCRNRYHNYCYMKAPICSHPILQHIKHPGSNRLDIERTTTTKNKEPSRSLPRFPLPRPSINTNQGVDISQDSYGIQPVPTISNVGYCSNVIQSTVNISSSLSSSSFFQQTSSLPSSALQMHHMPQSLLTVNGPLITSTETLRPSMIKPSSDSVIDIKKPHKHVSEWEIRAEDLLSRGRMVGRGTYGTVYRAEVRLHGLIALKELNFVSPTPSQFQAFRNEVIALKKITHQNTLNFYGYILSPRFAIVTQWCEGSTLYKHIHVLDRHWKINQLIDIARQICQGMSYLHDRGIIHRDLKSSNIFLDMSSDPDDVGASCRVKIGDFGLAAVKTVLAESINQQFQPSGSVLWMAPEVIQQKDPNCYSPSADVYAYGCVLFEMFSGKLPHTPITNKEQIMWLVGKGRLKLKVEQCRDDTPTAITNLIRQCIEYDHEKRPNFAPEIDDTLSKFECIFPRLQRSQSEPCLIRAHQDDLLGLSIHFGVPKTPVSIHRRFNAEVS
ncbi:unnamed protein product [Rotaria sp. Silwood2]|nr:unnamed protein product [Rotaria sp. Silwood2]CAF2649033.1 unnamed protein product [Rotaria sp. Silwood2]CAF2929514.1 unnamed protein product [Rotaria sp. Silwood2]CAF3061495.1 unnamed protein product [Rotaria sp. Silwood2]CAF3963691.1 unnamed protein product [Rotaria sp. Silwood2]